MPNRAKTKPVTCCVFPALLGPFYAGNAHQRSPGSHCLRSPLCSKLRPKRENLVSIKSLFFVLFTVGCGCSSSVAGEPALKSLARGMSQGYPAVDLQMTMTWTRRGDQEY